MDKLDHLHIVVPTLNAARELKFNETLKGYSPIFVSDGGSSDSTFAIVRELGATLVEGACGRGAQLAAGGEAAIEAGAAWLMFLHADTSPEPNWETEVADFISEPSNLERAGVFRLRLDENSAAAERVACLALWRSRFLGLPYGDQGLVISTYFYRRLNGFRDIPLMEDVDLVRRIGRERLHLFDTAAITSAVRYQRDGYWFRPVRNLFCLLLFYLGVPPRVISKIYS